MDINVVLTIYSLVAIVAVCGKKWLEILSFCNTLFFYISHVIFYFTSPFPEMIFTNDEKRKKAIILVLNRCSEPGRIK